MLPPAPDDFWQRVVTELARMVWQRETGARSVSIVTGMHNVGVVTSYAHDTRKPWHAQGESRSNMPADEVADPA